MSSSSTLSRVPRWGRDSLDRLTHGTARIEEVVPDDDGATVLRLRFYDGSQAELQVEALPDSVRAGEALPEGGRPLAVLLRQIGLDLGFSVLVAGGRGSVRLPIDAAGALWLLQHGTHGVIRCGETAQS